MGDGRPPALSRRAFLRGLAAAPGAVLLACEAGRTARLPEVIDASVEGIHGETPVHGSDVACSPTSPDLLGPYYRKGAPGLARLAAPSEPGDPFLLVLDFEDTRCRRVPGGVLELWQADAGGAYHDGRLRTRLDVPASGRVAIPTIVPGRYLQATGWRPAHIHLRLTRPDRDPFVTQLYFAGDPYLGAADSCDVCDASDPARHLVLEGDGQGRWAWLRVVT